MIKKIITTVVLSCSATLAIGQNNNVFISGKIDPAILKLYNSKELTITNNYSLHKLDTLGKVKVDDSGNFKTVLDLKDSLSYVAFNLTDETGGRWSGKLVNISSPRQEFLAHQYLFKRGDSISMEVRDKKRILFGGRGASKLNFQAYIYAIPALPMTTADRSNDLANKHELFKKLTIDKNVGKLSVKLKLELLESYKDEISVDIYNRLYLDAISTTEYSILNENSIQPMIFTGNSNLSLIRKDYLNYLQNFNEYKIDTNYVVNSAYYSDLILKKEATLIALFQGAGTNALPEFKSLYEKIKNTYRGEFRERLIYLTFVDWGTLMPEQAKVFLSDAHSILKLPEYKKLFDLWQAVTYLAYPFNLFDVDDKIHSLSDYKGKVVVIDVWFTGCLACTYLTKCMEPIINKYQNKNVVFLSMSTDNKKTWLHSLKTGIYTNPKMVNLHTNGLGYKHPFFKYYGWSGAPQQLIIGKHGELISSHPPRPDVGPDNLKLFTDLVDKALTK